MKKPMRLILLVLGVCVITLSAPAVEHPPISFVIPGGSTTSIDKSKFLYLVVDAGFISHDSSPIAPEAVTEYINTALKAQGATMLAVHIRQGVKFGEVVQALDLLRKTEAKSIGVSMVELSPGKEP